MHVRCHFESVKTPEGGLSWQGCPKNQNMYWFLWIMQMRLWADLCKDRLCPVVYYYPQTLLQI